MKTDMLPHSHNYRSEQAISQLMTVKLNLETVARKLCAKLDPEQLVRIITLCKKLLQHRLEAMNAIL